MIANVLGWQPDDARLELVFLKVYENFIEAMDAVDNGVAQVPGTKPLYKNNTTLSHRVGGLNPSWNEEPGDMMVRAHHPASQRAPFSLTIDACAAGALQQGDADDRVRVLRFCERARAVVAACPLHRRGGAGHAR